MFCIMVVEILEYVIDRVAATITRYRMLEPGAEVGVAVSGGADSVCLWHVMRDLGYRVIALHLNHHLRGEESDGDEAFVRALDSRAVVGRWRWNGKGNLEQEARRARGEFFRASGFERVATAHTRSDQAETLLFRLVRGTGPRGLAGILPVTRDGLVRPLIDVTRGEVVEYLRGRAISWREDSSNVSDDFARNRFRSQLVPWLRQENPEFEETLARAAHLAAADESYWEQEMDRLAVNPIEAATLASMHPAVAGRVVRRLIERVRGDVRSIDHAHVERVLTLARQADGDGRADLPGCSAIRSFGQVWVGHPAGSGNFRYRLSVPHSEAQIPGNASIRVDVIESEKADPSIYNGDGNRLDWNRVETRGELAVRNWEPGDSYHSAGDRRERTLHERFQSSRVPSWERGGWPVVTAGDSILWTRRFGVAAWASAGPETRAILLVREMAATEVIR